jgi:hypothetical protein
MKSEIPEKHMRLEMMLIGVSGLIDASGATILLGFYMITMTPFSGPQNIQYLAGFTIVSGLLPLLLAGPLMMVISGLIIIEKLGDKICLNSS